jgi:hypothetical protein
MRWAQVRATLPRQPKCRILLTGLKLKIPAGAREDLPMITAVVRFKLPATMDAAKAAEVFQASASRYQGLAGLVRKYYLFDAENHTGGGCYLWESREAAERVYNAEWRKMITERYGAPPDISFFETPVIVDNTLGKTILDAAE